MTAQMFGNLDNSLISLITAEELETLSIWVGLIMVGWHHGFPETSSFNTESLVYQETPEATLAVITSIGWTVWKFSLGAPCQCL